MKYSTTEHVAELVRDLEDERNHLAKKLFEEGEAYSALLKENTDLRTRIEYERQQRIALQARLEELDPPEEFHGT